MAETVHSPQNNFAEFADAENQDRLTREAGEELLVEQQEWNTTSRPLNDAAEMRIYGSRGHTYHDTETGDVIADADTILPSRADQIRTDSSLHLDPREREKLAQSYMENIADLTDAYDLELFQAEEIAEARLKDREHMFDLANRYVAGEGGIRHDPTTGETVVGSMDAEAAVALARNIYDRNDVRRVRTAMLANPYTRQFEINVSGAPSAPEQQIDTNRKRIHNTVVGAKDEQNESNEGNLTEETPEAPTIPKDKLEMSREEWNGIVAEVRRGPGVTPTYFVDTLGYEPAAAIAIFEELQNQGIVKGARNKVGLYAAVEPGEWLRDGILKEGEIALNGLRLSAATRRGRRHLNRLYRERSDNPFEWNELDKAMKTTLPETPSLISFVENAPALPRVEKLADRLLRQQQERRTEMRARYERRAAELAEKAEEKDNSKEDGDSGVTAATRSIPIRPANRTDSKRPGDSSRSPRKSRSVSSTSA
jgi:ribosomal protein S25